MYQGCFDHGVEIWEMFGAHLEEVKAYREGDGMISNWIVQGDLPAIKRICEENNVGYEEVEAWGVRVWAH